MPLTIERTENDYSTILHRLVGGKIVVEEMQRNLYGVPKDGEYTLEITGIAEPFEMTSELYGTQAKTRVEYTIRGGKGDGRMFTDLYTWSLGAKSNLGKIATAALGGVAPNVGQFELENLLGKQVKAYVTQSERLDDNGKPLFAKVTIDTVKPVAAADDDEDEDEDGWPEG